MQRFPSKCLSTERATWLAQLTAAIDEAQELAWRVAAEGPNREVMDLYARLELVRCEVESLRRSGWASTLQEIPSDWTEFLPDALKNRLPSGKN